MKAVSEVIAIILILMITISLAGLAYMFMSTTMSDVTSSAGSTVDTTTSSMLTSFKIETMDISKVYVRNTGQNTITSLSVYVNDVPAHINMTPASIAPGQIGTITIYDFIMEDDTIKITSPSGFSTSKRATDPCDKALTCWSFDEGTGSRTLSSNGAYGGTLRGSTWTSGRYGNAIHFTGIGTTGSRVNVFDSPDTYTDNQNLKYTGGDLTITAWVNIDQVDDGGDIISKGWNGMGRYNYRLGWGSGNTISFFLGGDDQSTTITTTQTYARGQWHYIAATVSSGSAMQIYVDGALAKTGTCSVTTWVPSSAHYGDGNIPLCIGSTWPYQSTFEDSSGQTINGTIDEVRIYNRAIY